MKVDSADYDWFASDEHRKSPIHAVWSTNRETRRRLADPGCPMDYAVLAELRAEGATDSRRGTPTRIEFTVVGAAANEAARIESLCKDLQVDLLVSDRVARALPGKWRSLGEHTLRGVGDKMELFTLP